MYNPYQFNMPLNYNGQQYAQTQYNAQQVTRVTGENGARSLQLAPNSSAIVLDETAPLIWLIQSDGAGYKTVTPYKIEPYSPSPPVDINSLEERIKKLEVKISESNASTIRTGNATRNTNTSTSKSDVSGIQND